MQAGEEKITKKGENCERFRKRQNLQKRYVVNLVNAWFQKISIPPPQRELEIPGGWGKGPGNSGGEGGFEEKFTSRWKEINRLTSYVRRCRLPTFVGHSEVLSS